MEAKRWAINVTNGVHSDWSGSCVKVFSGNCPFSQSLSLFSWCLPDTTLSPRPYPGWFRNQVATSSVCSSLQSNAIVRGPDSLINSLPSNPENRAIPLVLHSLAFSYLLDNAYFPLLDPPSSSLCLFSGWPTCSKVCRQTRLISDTLLTSPGNLLRSFILVPFNDPGEWCQFAIHY